MEGQWIGISSGLHLAGIPPAAPPPGPMPPPGGPPLPPMGEEPPLPDAKRARTDFVLEDSDEFAARHPGASKAGAQLALLLDTTKHLHFSAAHIRHLDK